MTEPLEMALLFLSWPRVNVADLISGAACARVNWSLFAHPIYSPLPRYSKSGNAAPRNVNAM